MEYKVFLGKVSEKLSGIKADSNADVYGQYNIFDVLGVGSKEVIVCRFLADLLNPKGKHGCDNKKSSYPGFAYSILQLEFEGKSLDVRFRVEIDYCLFAGICVFDTTNHVGKEYILKDHNIISLLGKYINGVSEGNSYWAVWEYLPEGEKNGSEAVPDFKNMNEAAIKLFDKNEMNRFVGKCVVTIKKFLDNTIIDNNHNS